MLDSLTVENILADCMQRIELFNKNYNGRAFNRYVRVMSTFGNIVLIRPDDRYECHETYLYVHHSGRERDASYRKTAVVESVSFVPYESIVCIECESKAYV